MSDKTVGVLLMVKNEEKSIKNTINSTSKYIKNVIVLDTGSTDGTIDEIKKVCKQNNQSLFLKESEFINFPESRNEAIEFAESVDVKFLILMDAGDELKSSLDKDSFLSFVNNVSKEYNYGLVKHSWKVKEGQEDHYDVRFIRNKHGCRYDSRYLVHEKFRNVTTDIFTIGDIFYLFQDRDKYGESTKSRYVKDISNLLKSVQNQRNLYYLGQTYLNMEDYENAYKYNLKCWETEPDDDVLGEHILKEVLVRIGFCAIKIEKPKDVVFKYLEYAINKFKEPPIQAFIFLFVYSIEHKCVEDVIKYARKLAMLEKPNDLSFTNHNYFDYKRWNLISIACLLCNRELDLGYDACNKARRYGSLEDKNNFQIYQFLLRSGKLNKT